MKKYLWRHPKGYIYIRKGGKLVGRIMAPEGTAEFDREYWEYLNGKKLAARTSWSALVKDYRQSDRWASLKTRTRQDYEPILAYIIEKNGGQDMTRVTRKDAIAAQRANQHRVRFANYIVQVMSVLCEHAIDIGWMKANPVKGTRHIKTPDAKKQDHLPWPDAAVKKWRAEASQLTLLIFEIGVGSVQRPGDWPGFDWGDYDGESLRLRQNKTDKPLVLPCTEELKAALDKAKAALSFAPLPSRPILTKASGDRMDYRHMARLMLDERKRLGLEAYDLHALRYRGVKELAWAGCDDDEIASYSGHATKAMIQKYAGEARQEMRARQAREKRSRK